jgi:hypothetical protein
MFGGVIFGFLSLSDMLSRTIMGIDVKMNLFTYASNPTSISALILFLCSIQAWNIMFIVVKKLMKST